MDVTIVADDLTGACDTGALFAGRGPVSVVIAPALPEADPEVVTLDTETRALSETDAASAVRRLSAALAPRLARSAVFKKIDSTFRGPVAAELDALVVGARARAALVCPAFPAMGRTVVHGLLSVHGVPVHHSPIGSDPDYRASTSDLVEMLAGRSALPVSLLPLKEVRGTAADLARAARERRGLVVVDAETDADLRALVHAAHGHSDLILAGSAGLAHAASAAWGHAATVPDLPAGSCLVVAGSRHPATRDQIAALERAGITGLRVEQSGGVSTRSAVQRLREGDAAFIASAEALEGTREEMAARLGAAAGAVLAEVVPDLLVVTGGDTALALLRALGARRLELVGAPASGLALGRLVLDARPPITVLTKAGGFGAADFLVSLATGAVR
jgi:uncharacterized protein YgbK (DUF1537 family)